MTKYQTGILVLRSNGETTIRGPYLEQDDTECKHCGERTEYLHLNEVHIPTMYEPHLLAALRAEDVERFDDFGRVSVTIDDIPEGVLLLDDRRYHKEGA